MSCYNDSLCLSSEEEKTLHWDGIVAVCTGQFKSLTEAKEVLRQKMLLKKKGVNSSLLNYSDDPKILEFMNAVYSGRKWGDLWWDSTYEELSSTKKRLRQIYVDLALEPSGRWRLGAEKIKLEERLGELQKELGLAA